jgi:hypothetical protein
MINENLQILHLPTLLSSLLWLSSSPLLPLGFFLFPALILLLVVPHHVISWLLWPGELAAGGRAGWVFWRRRVRPLLGFTGRDKMGGRLSCALVRCWEKEGGSMCKQGGRRLPRALQFVLQKSGEREEIGLG